MTTEIIRGAGSGGSVDGTLLLYDWTQSGIGNQNYYNENALDFVSGNFRANYNQSSDITFTSKVSGTMKWETTYNSSSPSLYVNGTDVFSQGSLNISAGDTIRWVSPLYWNVTVVYME